MRRIIICALLPAALAAGEDLQQAVRTAELGRAYDHALLDRAATSSDAATRRAAARAGGRIKDPRAVEWLLPMLDDPRGPVRRSALFALGQIGGDTIVIPLRSRLARLERNDLPFALEALGKTRDARAVTEAARYLRHVDRNVRGEAALALFRLGDVSALPELFGALSRETDPEARWRQVYSCWFLIRKRARESKMHVDLDPEWTALLLASARGDGPVHERIFATRALASVAGQREFVVGQLSDDDPSIVLAAVRGSAAPWSETTARAVAGLATHENSLVRGEVVSHVVAGGAPATALMLEIAPKVADDHRLYARVQEALAEHGKDIAFLPAELDGGPAHREATRWSVLSHSPKRLPRELPKTTRGQVAAADVCGEERVPDARATAVLLELLKVKDFTVRASAIASLAKRGAKEHAGAIVAAAVDSPGTVDMDVRIEAAKALAGLEHHDVWLQAAADDPDAPVRKAARAALEKLGKPAPAARPAAGFRLHGHDAAGVVAAAEALHGARLKLTTSRGVIEMMLLPEEAPAHCVSLAALVAEGFYDGLTWHRVVGNFVIQGGCPRGDGWGGPGYALPDEIGKRARYLRGAVGMPKSDDDTGGCQIFITHIPTPHLDGRYTIFAQVVAGLDVVDKIRVDDKILKAELGLARAGNASD